MSRAGAGALPDATAGEQFSCRFACSEAVRTTALWVSLSDRPGIRSIGIVLRQQEPRSPPVFNAPGVVAITASVLAGKVLLLVSTAPSRRDFAASFELGFTAGRSSDQICR